MQRGSNRSRPSHHRRACQSSEQPAHFSGARITCLVCHDLDALPLPCSCPVSRSVPSPVLGCCSGLDDFSSGGRDPAAPPCDVPVLIAPFTEYNVSPVEMVCFQRTVTTKSFSDIEVCRCLIPARVTWLPSPSALGHRSVMGHQRYCWGFRCFTTVVGPSSTGAGRR